MKTPEKLKALKEDVEAMNNDLSSLTEDELKDVSAGENTYSPCSKCNRRSCEGCSNGNKEK